MGLSQANPTQSTTPLMAKRRYGAENKIIGESPPRFGGKKAYSTIGPTHEGTCLLHYSFAGKSEADAFASYRVAMSAATRAIFCTDLDFSQVLISEAFDQKQTPTYFVDAESWLSEKLNQVLKL